MSNKTRAYSSSINKAGAFLESALFKDLEDKGVSMPTVMAIQKLHSALLICQHRLSEVSTDTADAAETANNALNLGA